MIKAGLTGGIGSGKSLVSSVFSILKVPVFNSDLEAKQILDTNSGVKKKLSALFGNDIYFDNGEINRKKFASVIFSNPENLSKANSVIHPAVQQKYKDWLRKNPRNVYTVKEAAILFESGSYKYLDFIITVYAPVEIRIERVMKRDNVSYEMVLERMKNQLSDEEKVKMADFVIYNDGYDFLIPQVLKIHKILLNRKS